MAISFVCNNTNVKSIKQARGQYIIVQMSLRRGYDLSLRYRWIWVRVCLILLGDNLERTHAECHWIDADGTVRGVTMSMGVEITYRRCGDSGCWLCCVQWHDVILTVTGAEVAQIQ